MVLRTVDTVPEDYVLKMSVYLNLRKLVVQRAGSCNLLL